MKKTIYFLGYIIGFIIIAYISYTYVKTRLPSKYYEISDVLNFE